MIRLNPVNNQIIAAYQGFEPRIPSSREQSSSFGTSIPFDDPAKKIENTAESGAPEDSTSDSTSNFKKESQDSTSELTEEERRRIEVLKKTDTEVRSHEMAHIAAGGQYISSGARLKYERGPDGVSYAVAGEVSIDTSPVPGDPQATITKMQQVKSAALAPANPSSQDRKVAAYASSQAAQALTELMTLQTKTQAASRQDSAAGTFKEASTSYLKNMGPLISVGSVVEITA